MGLTTDDEKYLNDVIKAVEKIINDDSFINKNYEEHLQMLYTKNYMFHAIKSYASYLILEKKYGFYDPYILKRISPWIKNEKYYLHNAHRTEEKIINDYITEFGNYSKDMLQNVFQQYIMKEPSVYEYKNSRYYFTGHLTIDDHISHYSYMASIKLLADKFNVNIENPIDLKSENNDDFKRLRNEALRDLAIVLSVKGLAKLDDKINKK